MPDLKNNKELPLVSCIMPTYNRRKFVPFAIEYFERQNYPNKELIIIDDGSDIIEDIVPNNALIKYYKLNKKISLGAKLNMACNYAGGDIIFNWDDDDWYAPTRIQYQLDSLTDEGIEVCGINNLLYYDLHNNKGYQYIYPSNQRIWLLGSSLCYRKKLWCKNRFADTNVGMDGLFVWGTKPDCVKALSDSSMAVHMIHPNNVSPKKTAGAWWHKYPVESLQKIMKHDWQRYKNDEIKTSKKITVKNNFAQSKQIPQLKQIKNVHACLVHNNKECINDLVKNLHYNDPSSIILLYNGGNDKTLFNSNFKYGNYNAFIHPKPIAVKHGYLHNFALNCMEYALKNFDFDSITMVDSDQLFINSGYTDYLSGSNVLQPDVGMLSNKPQRLTYANNSDVEIWPTIQAFKEYELWKPLLQQFKDGESKFLHWTFWPSCVFTSRAAADLIQLFKENTTLQSIMTKTKIWATEEVILSTLVALLDYRIETNPCSYEYVKYQKDFSVIDVEEALNKPNAFWMHPVKRGYEDHLRKRIRETFSFYTKENIEQHEATHELLPTLPLLNKIRKLEGWLTDEEADLMISATSKACIHFSKPFTIVEVGCFHGKSTIIFGSVLAKFSPKSKIYSIDVHDGKQGAEGQGIFNFPPSFSSFKKNITEAGVASFVETIKDHSYNVQWQQPVSILFIDCLHDYNNVSRDFEHFAKWLVKDAYAIFHDYADYFSGVKIFVNELLQTGNYTKVAQADSLIIIKKVN